MEFTAKKAGYGLRVLVLDESAEVRAILRRLLIKLGITSLEHADGAGALAALASAKADCVLADLDPLTQHGLNFARAVRSSADKEMRATPILLVTGLTERGLIEAARDQGVNGVLVRPLTAAMLRARIDDVVYRPKLFIDRPGYAGPCRRRARVPLYQGPERRGLAPAGSGLELFANR